MKLETNSNSAPLAGILADAKKGTFTGIITGIKGTERGPKGAKVTYGNDLIHAVIYTGFKYGTLVQRSLDALATLDPKSELARLKAAGVVGYVAPPKPDAETRKALQKAAESTVNPSDFDTKGELRKEINRVRKAAKVQYEGSFSKEKIPVELTEADVLQAMAELKASFESTLAFENTSTTDHVFETLTVNGEKVRGARVYTGENAEEAGTVYIQGLLIGRKVLEAAPNGPAPKPLSKPSVAAKNFLRGSLPASRYVSFALAKGGDWLLNAGGTAQALSQATGLTFTPEVCAAIDRQAA